MKVGKEVKGRGKGVKGRNNRREWGRKKMVWIGKGRMKRKGGRGRVKRKGR